MLHTPVLIVGGSLVGLSASLFLSWRGVANVVVEKHAGSSPHPRAQGFTQTTLEHFRAVGISGCIPQVPEGTQLRRVVVESLAGRWAEEQAWTPGESVHAMSGLSPCTGAAIAQDKLEPLLRRAAAERGAELRASTELVSFEPDADGVVARLRDGNGAGELDITADYLIAADGADSPVREALGIGRSGVGRLRVLRSVLFRCPEADAYLDRGVRQFQVRREGFRAFLTTYGDSRWVLMFEGDEERTPDDLRTAIRAALGADMAFDILATGRWEMAGRIADAYRSGRVFLAGDAAHQLPPTRGGFGANTGIDDAWNLAWKLEHVIKGLAGPALLDTYDDERRPIGWLRHQQTFSRPDYAAWVGTGFVPEPLFGDAALEFGQLVRSSAVIGAGPSLPAAATPDQWKGQPGTRAPHCWIEAGGTTRSTLDLFGHGFVLMSERADWMPVARAFGLEAVHVASDVIFPRDQAFGDVFGVSPDGATLIRPDGVIAWRTALASGAGGAETLREALAMVTCR